MKGFQVLRLWESDIKIMSLEDFARIITRYDGIEVRA